MISHFCACGLGLHRKNKMKPDGENERHADHLNKCQLMFFFQLHIFEKCYKSGRGKLRSGGRKRETDNTTTASDLNSLKLTSFFLQLKG